MTDYFSRLSRRGAPEAAGASPPSARPSSASRTAHGNAPGGTTAGAWHHPDAVGGPGPVTSSGGGLGDGLSDGLSDRSGGGLGDDQLAQIGQEPARPPGSRRPSATQPAPGERTRSTAAGAGRRAGSGEGADAAHRSSPRRGGSSDVVTPDEDGRSRPRSAGPRPPRTSEPGSDSGRELEPGAVATARAEGAARSAGQAVYAAGRGAAEAGTCTGGDGNARAGAAPPAAALEQPSTAIPGARAALGLGASRSAATTPEADLSALAAMDAAMLAAAGLRSDRPGPDGRDAAAERRVEPVAAVPPRSPERAAVPDVVIEAVTVEVVGSATAPAARRASGPRRARAHLRSRPAPGTSWGW